MVLKQTHGSTSTSFPRLNFSGATYNVEIVATKWAFHFYISYSHPPLTFFEP